jgi:hypothetical protein
MMLVQLSVKPPMVLWPGHANLQRRTAGLALRWIDRFFHPSQSQQKSGFLFSTNFYLSFTTASTAKTKGPGNLYGEEPSALGNG